MKVVGLTYFTWNYALTSMFETSLRNWNDWQATQGCPQSIPNIVFYQFREPRQPI